MKYTGVIHHLTHQNNQKTTVVMINALKICFVTNLMQHYPLISYYSILTSGTGQKLLSINRAINMQYIGVIHHLTHQNNQK